MNLLCPFCGFPARPVVATFGQYRDAVVLLGVCPRCVKVSTRLPTGTEQKRTNAAAARAVANPARYFAAVFTDLGAAQLAAGLLAHPAYAKDVAYSLGWVGGEA